MGSASRCGSGQALGVAKANCQATRPQCSEFQEDLQPGPLATFAQLSAECEGRSQNAEECVSGWIRKI